MRIATTVCLCLTALLPGGQAVAQMAGMAGDRTAHAAPKAVLELFTSEACSSCPPADALLKRYAERKDLVALTFHVDYWDYLGWKDTFASSKNSDRQRAYSKAMGDGMVYTPQMVVNGRLHIKGSNRAEIDSAIDKGARQLADRQAPVVVSSDKGQLVIEVGAGKPGAVDAPAATVWLAVVQKVATSSVRAGENSGKTLSYANVVRDLTPVGTWDGKPATIRLDGRAVMRHDTEACAVLVQQGPGGPIVGAAWLAKW